jgi:signal transduction histidine kinase
MQARTVSSRLLGLARTQAAEREPVDLNGLVRDVLCLLRRQLGRQEIELVEELEAGLPAVLGHASQLQQVILNLVQNSQEAIRSSRRTGRIWVRTRGQGGQVVLEVEDDGPGVPAPIRDRVFEPFFTTKSGAQGTGLGLSVCQQVARSHGGQLRLAPRAWGACMVVELPGVDGVILARAAAAPRVARSSA